MKISFTAFSALAMAIAPAASVLGAVDDPQYRRRLPMTRTILYDQDFEHPNVTVRERGGDCQLLAAGTINEYYGGQINPTYGSGAFGQ